MNGMIEAMGAGDRRAAGGAAVAVVGGGVTGLTAAWRLQQAGIAVRVFEKSGCAGGRTMSIRKDGFVFDVGAITLLPTYTHTSALVEELGIGAHLHRVSPLIGIPRDGRIHTLDVSRPLRSLIGTQLISAASKLRLLKLLGPLRSAWSLSTFKTLSTLGRWDGESIADFVRRELNEEIHEYIAGPIIRGNTLNSTECAPAGELLWMLRQYAAPFVSGFDQGINFLAETLASRLPVELGAEVTAVERSGAGVTVRGRGREGEFAQRFDACILALPPPQLLSFAPLLRAGQRQFLESVEPLVSVNVHVGLGRRPALSHTFILPPESEQPDLTTIVADHLKAPGRAPPGKGVMSFFLRDAWCAGHFDTPDDEVLDQVLTMAQPFVGDLRGDVETYVVQRWPYAIIKSEAGLYARIRVYETDMDPCDRVQPAGDFLSMGMESAVTSGMDAAERVRQIVAHTKVSG